MSVKYLGRGEHSVRQLENLVEYLIENSFEMNRATMRSAWRRAHGDNYWQYFEPFLKQMFEAHIKHTIVREKHTKVPDEAR